MLYNKNVNINILLDSLARCQDGDHLILVDDYANITNLLVTQHSFYSLNGHLEDIRDLYKWLEDNGYNGEGIEKFKIFSKIVTKETEDVVSVVTVWDIVIKEGYEHDRVPYIKCLFPTYEVSAFRQDKVKITQRFEDTNSFILSIDHVIKVNKETGCRDWNLLASLLKDDDTQVLHVMDKKPLWPDEELPTIGFRGDKKLYIYNNQEEK